MTDTFTKFDQLGAVLAEVSYRSVSLHMSRREDGSLMSTVYLHTDDLGVCVQGIGDTPSEALADGLAKMAAKQVARVEAAAEKVA